jgi:very-short-patch-repair endonuclease
MKNVVPDLVKRARRVRQLMLDQHGLATRPQLLALGVHRGSIDRAVRSGRWRRAGCGVYATNDAPATPEQLVLSGVLTVGGDAVASHGAAAWLHGLLGFREAVREVSTSTPRRARGVEVHRTELCPRDCENRRGIPCTRVGRTLLDVAEILKPERLEAVLDDVLRRKLVRVPLVQRLVDERGTQGRRGASVLAQLLFERRGDYVPTESRLEDLFVALVKKAGLPKPRRQVPLANERGVIFAEVDFAYERERIAIWLDGVAYHGDVATWRYDLDQTQEAVRLGWRTVRFTWEMVTKREQRVIETLSTLLVAPTFSHEAYGA